MPSIQKFTLAKNNGQILLTVTSDDPRRSCPIFALFDYSDDLWDMLYSGPWYASSNRICTTGGRSLSLVMSNWYFGVDTKKRAVNNDDFTRANYLAKSPASASRKAVRKPVHDLFLSRHAKQKYRRVTDTVELAVIDANTSEVMRFKFNKSHAHLVPKYANINSTDGIVCKDKNGGLTPLYRNIIDYNNAMLDVRLPIRRPNFKLNDYTTLADGTWSTSTVIRAQKFVDIGDGVSILRIQQRASGIAEDDTKWRKVADSYKYYYIAVPTEHVEHLSEFNWFVNETSADLVPMALRDGTTYRLARVIATLCGLNIDSVFIPGRISKSYQKAIDGVGRNPAKTRAKFESKELSSESNWGKGRVFTRNVAKTRSNVTTDVVKQFTDYSDEVVGNGCYALCMLANTIRVG